MSLGEAQRSTVPGASGNLKKVIIPLKAFKFKGIIDQVIFSCTCTMCRNGDDTACNEVWIKQYSPVALPLLFFIHFPFILFLSLSSFSLYSFLFPSCYSYTLVFKSDAHYVSLRQDTFSNYSFKVLFFSH